MDPTTWDMPFPLVALVLFGIVMVRANATYWLGRGVVAGTSRTRLRRLLTAPGYARAAGWLARWGAPAVTFSFLTVGVQTLVNFAAGATRMPLRRYLPAVVVGSVAWALVYATVGLVSLTAFSLLYDRSPALAVVLATLVVAFLVGWVVSQTRASHREAPPEPSPAASQPETASH